ncbi:MAG: nitrous oxide reductase family maturation protein NosD [Planctomycetes bacterium]|nr:nitrous oxide reductase family maturation protein NosD [Planctomycetota bacterium]
MRPRDALLLLALLAPAARAGDTWTVGPGDDLARALEAAEDGDTVVVDGGVHAPVVVTRRLALEGRGWPVIDGGGRGTVVKLAAAGASLRGFVVRGSGSSLDDENSGITVAAPDVRVEGNRVEEALFGVSLAHARGSVVADNVITGKALDVARRGDAIRVWYSDDVRLERNVVTRGRDVVLWYSAHLTVADNEVTDGRYGLHFMYTDDADIQRNRLVGNSVGVYLMYSRRLRMSHNAVVGNRGPSGFGLGLKDMDECDVTDNVFADNRVGAYVDNSPREAQSFLIFRRNLFAGNDTGVALLPSVRKNTYSENAFVDNGEHVGVLGGGTLGANAWSDGGRGNFWSDYAGYDRDGDGVGDVPYRSERLFEHLAQRHPELKLFVYTPAANAVELAARAVPLVRPQPKLLDDAPLVAPVVPAGVPRGAATAGAPLVLSSAGLVALAALVIFGVSHRGPPACSGGTPAGPGAILRRRGRTAGTPVAVSSDVVNLEAVTKRFGQALALDGLTLTVRQGEALAFWGANGAGKTTALRCLLGVIPFQGRVTLAGHDVRRAGKAARRLVGFVPQELTFHDDLTVRESLAFYARLKRVPAGDDALLARLGLAEHAHKAVRELSGGLKQRLAVALALLGDPPLLVLDEPTANLDAPARASLVALLAELKAAGKTLVFTSHRLEEVLALADRVVLLEGGRLAADVPPRDLGERLRAHATLHLLLPPLAVERAEAVLVDAGLLPTRTGAGLSVEVDPAEKGRPIALLVNAGVPLADFEVARTGAAAGRS